MQAWGTDMELCQIQLNYLDWTFQDAKAKVELLNRWNIPVWVMEPLRGGKLATLSDADAEKLHALRPDETAPGWAFRFLQTIPGVTVILSGMSSSEQMRQNIRTFETEASLKEQGIETKLIQLAGGNVAPCKPCFTCGGKQHCTLQADLFAKAFEKIDGQSG